MRELILTRGLPGCGKSTFLATKFGDQNVISADKIRCLYSGLKQTVSGGLAINDSCDRQVWKFINDLVEFRMKNGCTVILDATFYKLSSIKSYKSLCETYNYRLTVLDFYPETDESEDHLETALEFNASRENWKRVPDEVIFRMWKTMKEENKSFPNWIRRVSIRDLDSEAYDFIHYKPFSYDQFDKIYVFGDLHGCFEPLKEFFEKNPYSQNNAYIFVGDYIDRGIQNKETLEFLFNLVDYKNVSFLEGNHERWLRKLYKGEKDFASKEFRDNTIPQIQNIPLDSIRHFIRRLKTFMYITFNGNRYFISHGGLSSLPDIFTNESDIINGCGSYNQAQDVEKAFSECYSSVVQIHGHRNVDKLPFEKLNNCYNLEGHIEFGGYLRVLEISRSGERTISIKNNIFKNPNDVEYVLKDLEHSDLIKEKQLGNGISSFNFNKEAFFDKRWNNLTTKARGLFINKEEKEIIARSYNKFFNLNELPETTEIRLRSTLKFPVTAYLKENGYLGILSWNHKENDYFIASKSTNRGEFADNFARILKTKYKIDKNEKLKKFLREGFENKKFSLVFEVIDPIFDPHIIEYKEEQVVLLDCVSNDFNVEFVNYDNLTGLEGLAINLIGCPVKKKMKVFEDADSLFDFINHYDPKDRIEGYVFVDSDSYMFKFKTPFYSFWKQIRNNFGKIKDSVKELYEKDFSSEIEVIEQLSDNDRRNYIENGNFRVIKFYKDIYEKLNG